MIGAGYYIIEYNYKDKRGYIRTKRVMRGSFELALEVYRDLIKMAKEKRPKAPIQKPRVLQASWGGNELEIDFKKELEEWRNMKLNTKK